MEKSDIGIILIFITYLTTIGYIIFEYYIGNIDLPYKIAFVIGKSPYLFILNLVLYLIGSYLLINGVSRNKEELDPMIDMLFFFMPTLNLVIAFLFLVMTAGGEGILYFGTEVYFILMYNFLLYLIGIVISLRGIVLSKEVKISIGYLLLIALYAMIRIYLGVYPLLEITMIVIVLIYSFVVLPRLMEQK